MNTVIQVIFLIISAIILGSALFTVLARNLVHAALWLVSAFLGVGGLYLLMEAEFPAVAQVLVYVGAVAILVLFAIMLTPDLAGEQGQPIFRGRLPALLITAGLFGLLIVPTLMNYSWAGADTTTTIQTVASAQQLGTALMREYLLPFELASVLLLAALIGAIVIGLDESARRRVLTLAEEFRLRQRASEQREQEPDSTPEGAMEEQAPHA